MAFDDLLVYALVAVGVILGCGIGVYAYMRYGRKRETASKEQERAEADLTGLPFKVVKSVPRDDAVHAREELRILDLEREILSDAIRKLYEAQAEGKITEEEREKLGQTYKARMMSVKDAITKDQSVVALHELETMQEDLMKLFSERFDELTGKIDELRSKVEVKPFKEIAIPTPKPSMQPEIEDVSTDEEKAKKKRKQAPAKPSQRTEAEKRIDEIRAEVEKVLDRLGQMEVES